MQAVHCSRVPSLRDTIYTIDVNLSISFNNFQINESVLKKGHLFKIPTVVPWGLAVVLELLAPALAPELSPRIIPTGQHALRALTFLLDEIKRILWGIVTQQPFCKVNGSLGTGKFFSLVVFCHLLKIFFFVGISFSGVHFRFNITFGLRPPTFPCPLP